MKFRLVFIVSLLLAVGSNVGFVPAYAASTTSITDAMLLNPVPCVTFSYSFNINIDSGDSVTQVNRDLTNMRTGVTVSGFKLIDHGSDNYHANAPIADPPGTEMGDMLNLTLSWTGTTSSGSVSVQSPCSNNAVCPMFFDGRLNNCDPGETFAVYCEPNNSVTVLAIYKGKGYFAFTATPKRIARVPVNPKKNTLIMQHLGARLYRLTSGWLQVNRAEDGTGKEYKYTFPDCTAPLPPGATPAPLDG